MTLRWRPGFQQWDPSMIETALWLDAADSSTITESGGLISQVNDKSGNSRNFTASGGARPTYTSDGLNSLPVFTFSGEQFLTSADPAATWNFLHNADGASAFCVVKMGATVNPNVAYPLWGTNSGTFSQTGVYTYYDDRAATSSSNAINSGVSMGVSDNRVSLLRVNNVWTPNKFVLFGQKYNNASNVPSQRNVVRFNAGQVIGNNSDSVAPSVGNASFTLQIGAAGNGVVRAVMDLPEIIITFGVVGTNTRQRIEGYLAHKWGLTANLPSDHPYKINAPAP